MTWRAAPAALMVMTTKSLLLTQFGGSASADVDSPADEVFALLTDTSRLPEWNTRIRRVLESARPLAPGAEWVVQMQVSGARWPSRSTAVTYDPAQRVFEHTSRSDDGNPASALWCWRVTPIPGQRSRIEVSWHVTPRTFWRRALFGKLRRHQMGDEVPASLRALGALAQDSVTAS
jgi:uncharacterized protein YndB with AHSA1/START domain